MNTKSVEITVFTCTYNRLATISRTYESLLSQTHKNFEWVIVDNGSTDDTISYLKSIEHNAPFPIRIHRRETNTGFQNAYNKGIAMANGEFYICLDSDDACVPESLTRLMEIWHSIPETVQHEFVGVTVNCEDQHGNLVGDLYPETPFDSNNLETEMRYKIKGEKWGLLKLEILRQYPFPVSDQHINPSLVWRAISRQYKTRYTNDVLRIYYINESGREDQISFHRNRKEAAFGKRLNAMELLNKDINWFTSAPFIFAKNAMNYSRNSFLLGLKTSDQLSDIQPFLSKVLVALSFPYGAIWSQMVSSKEAHLN